VLTNLVDNAVKFTGSGAVTLAVRDGGDGMLEFSVSDTGCGIEHARLKTVFARFSRSGAGAGDGEGTGLGLSIARSIVEAHGGRMWAESAPGEGARFSFTVPRGDARPGAPG